MSETATIPQATEELITRIRMTANLFAKDVAAMPHEQLATSPGGKARRGYDLVYEVASVNKLVAMRARGDHSEMPERTGWPKAPEDACEKDAALQIFQSSVDEACEAIAQLPPERYDELAGTPMGPIPMMRFAAIIPLHHMYHSGQLNYIQTLHGDEEFHW